MKSILFFMSLFLVSCSTTEATTSWIANLLGVKNANYLADSSGVITMDGFTYTIAEVLGPYSAVYNVYLGEFSNRERAPFGFVRVELNSEALSDPLILKPLSVSTVTSSIEEAKSAVLLTSSQITTVPSAVINARFKSTVANLSYRELETNGANVGEGFNVQRDDDAAVAYIKGVVTTDGQNIFFQDVAFRMTDDNKKVFSGYYLTNQWTFVRAINDTQAVYQQVSLTKFTPDTEFYFNDAGEFPRRATQDPPVGPNIYIGVEKRGDALYFHYPSPFVFYDSEDSVTFSSGYSIKVGRPITQAEIDIL